MVLTLTVMYGGNRWNFNSHETGWETYGEIADEGENATAMFFQDHKGQRDPCKTYFTEVQQAVKAVILVRVLWQW